MVTVVKGLKTAKKVVAHARVVPEWLRKADYMPTSLNEYRLYYGGNVSQEDRTIIEFCCGSNSVLGQNHPWNKGCRVVRLTKDTDMITPAGRAYAYEQLSHAAPGKVMLWASIPCTGGCPRTCN